MSPIKILCARRTVVRARVLTTAVIVPLLFVYSIMSSTGTFCSLLFTVWNTYASGILKSLLFFLNCSSCFTEVSCLPNFNKQRKRTLHRLSPLIHRRYRLKQLGYRCLIRRVYHTLTWRARPVRMSRTLVAETLAHAPARMQLPARRVLACRKSCTYWMFEHYL